MAGSRGMDRCLSWGLCRSGLVAGADWVTERRHRRAGGLGCGGAVVKLLVEPRREMVRLNGSRG